MPGTAGGSLLGSALYDALEPAAVFVACAGVLSSLAIRPIR
jgi:hypothetical protein